MTHNRQSRTVSLRIDHDAYAVLEWDAQRTMIPLRTTLRELAEERAERLSREFGLAYHDDDPKER